MQDMTAETPPEPPGTPEPPGGQASLAARLGAAAVGPCGAEHYLSAFARLDAAGRVVALWNWAAAAAGPAWLAFRALWRELAVYAVLALGVAVGVVLAHGQTLLPPAVLAGIALALWLASAAALGLWGDALVHRDVRRRVEAAVACAATVQQAAQQLQSAAPTRRRLWLVAGLLVVVVAVAAAAGLRWGGEPDRAAEHGAPQVSGTVTVSPPPPAPRESVQEPVPADVPGWDEAEARAVQGETDAVLAALQASGHAPAVEDAPKAGSDAPPPKRAGKPPKAAAAVQPPPATVRKLYINVGIFADPANAARVRERLRKEGLPVGVDKLERSGGKVLRRVRVGPFTSAAQANEAAAKVRLLGLDAVPAAQ